MKYKKILYFCILLILYSFAVTAVTDNAPIIPYTASDSVAWWTGYVIRTNSTNITVTEICKSPTETAGRCYIFLNNTAYCASGCSWGKALANASFTNNCCTVNASLNASSAYRLVVGDDGANHNRHYKSATYPYFGTEIKWEFGLYNLNYDSTQGNSIYNITYQNTTTGGGAPPADTNNTVPVNRQSIANSTNNVTGSVISGYCNATDAENTTLYYYYQWKRDGVVNESGYNNISEFCYQEFANVSNSCGGLNTGAYKDNELWSSEYKLSDGDYTTLTDNSNPITPGYFYINYTRPNNTNLYYSIWGIKGVHNNVATYKNITLPYQCHNETLKFFVESNINSNTAKYYCLNKSSEWLMLWNTSGTNGQYVYEEAIYWANTYKNGTMYLVDTMTATAPGNYTFDCKANDGVLNATSFLASSPVEIWGTIKPWISFNAATFFKTTNDTIIGNKTARNATLSFTAYDDYDLYAYSVYVFNESTTIFNYTNRTLDGLSDDVLLDMKVNASNGKYYVRINITDTHTDDYIKPMVVTTTKDALTFDNKISITAESATKATAIKLTDRYTFSFEYDKVIPVKTYYVESDGELDFQEKSLYPAHFVDYKNKKWIDFNGESGDLKITKITPYKYKVEITTSDIKTEFNSIGGLNEEVYTYEYFLFNPPAIVYNHPNTSTNWLYNDTDAMFISTNTTGVMLNTTTIRVYSSNGTLLNTSQCTTPRYNGSQICSVNYTPDMSVYHKFYVNATHTSIAGDNITAYLGSSDTLTYRQLSNPTIYLNFTLPSGFGAQNITTYMRCSHAWEPGIIYNMSWNGAKYISQNQTNGTLMTNKTSIKQGLNSIYGNCSTEYGSVAQNYTDFVYFIRLDLIDERNNTAFDVFNVTSAIIYFDDNSTKYDFQKDYIGGISNHTVNFSSLTNEKLRLELIYQDGGIVTRYFDVSLWQEPIMRICANREGVTHYEQLVLSSTIRAVYLKSNYATCYIAMDYTRFAYQDAYYLRAYSIDTSYNLYVYDGGQQVYLSAIDGALAEYINVDVLEFKQTGLKLNQVSDGLSIQKYSSTLMKIYYYNIDNNSDTTTLQVRRMDTNNYVLNESNFLNPNEFTVYYDFSGETGLTNNTQFQVIVTTTGGGVTNTIKKYFTTGGKVSSEKLNAGLAMVISILTIFFGLTFASSNSTFGIFGIFMSLFSLAIIAFSTITWYTTVLGAFNLIIVVYVIITMMQVNYKMTT